MRQTKSKKENKNQPVANRTELRPGIFGNKLICVRPNDESEFVNEMPNEKQIKTFLAIKSEFFHDTTKGSKLENLLAMKPIKAKILICINNYNIHDIDKYCIKVKN